MPREKPQVNCSEPGVGELPSSSKRETPLWMTWFAAGTALFHIWANTWGNISDLRRNALHLGLLGFLGFCLYSGRRKPRSAPRIPLTGLVAGAAVLASAFYLILFENALHARNEIPITRDLIVAGLAVILALELARRTSGYVIPGLAVLLMTYILWWGRHIGGVFGLRPMSLTRVLYRMYFTDEGLFGMISSISSTYVFMFILFAAFLLKSGGGDFIIQLSRRLTRRLAGGPGLVAVLASGLMGTISGSAVANTVSTGSITIPLMKRSGFSSRFAAAVETAASTGGQLMPPIMGAGAFIMAQWTQIPYATIIGVAFLPAVLYFASIGFSVYLEAKKENFQPRSAEEISTPAHGLLRGGLTFFIPIILLVGMLIAGFTPTYTAGFALLAVIGASWLGEKGRMTPARILDALAGGARNMVTTGLLLVVTGVVVGAINMTGISITFSQLIVEWSGSNIVLALLLITGASLLLGMGLPVTAAYIMIAILTAPALTDMGISLLAAHMIIFWLSQDSNVTPPVCLAAFAASSIADSRPMATGFTAWRLAKGLYVLPLLFAFSRIIDGSWGERIIISVFALGGFFALAAAMTGYLRRSLSWLKRGMALTAAVAMFWPNVLWLNLSGLSVLVLLFAAGSFPVHAKQDRRDTA